MTLVVAERHKDNQAVHTAIIWADQRSAKLVPGQIDRIGADNYVRL